MVRKTDPHSCRLKNIWRNMKSRCRNPNVKDYKNYGARGIDVGEDFEHFEEFYHWALNNGYSEELTLDRIDNNKGYAKDNCRWVSRTEQNNNARSNRIVEYEGKTYTIGELCRQFDLPYEKIRNRIVYLGYTVERAINKK